MIVYVFIALALALVGTWLDVFYTSPKFPYYGLTEANKLFRDAYGNFNFKKAVVVYAVVIAGFVCIGLFAHWFAGAALLAVVAIKGFWHGFDNLNAMKKLREVQIEKLTRLGDLVRQGLSTEYFWSTLRYAERGGRFEFTLFRWITVDASLANRRDILQRQIEDLSRRDPSEWFPK